MLSFLGSPFQCQVFDPNLVSVYGLDVGLVGQELRFTVDTSLAGEGTLKVGFLRASQFKLTVSDSGFRH